eukprot:jgi/Chlat1/7/ChrspC219599S00730
MWCQAVIDAIGEKVDKGYQFVTDYYLPPMLTLDLKRAAMEARIDRFSHLPDCPNTVDEAINIIDGFITADIDGQRGFVRHHFPHSIQPPHFRVYTGYLFAMYRVEQALNRLTWARHEDDLEDVGVMVGMSMSKGETHAWAVDCFIAHG